MGNGISVVLLHQMLVRMGELGDRDPRQIATRNFLDLVSNSSDPAETENKIYINWHLKHLKESNFLTVRHESTRQDFRTIELTAQGHAYLQPELAEFGRTPLLPLVTKSLEEKIQVLTYPEEEKSAMLYNLREAVAKQVPDLIAKVLAEIGYKIVTGK